MATFFVVNPVAGRGKALYTWQRVQASMDSAGVLYAHALTTGPGHATELAARAVAEGYEACVGVGGDGTLHEMLPALVGTATALGCVPAGTGNDFARTLGIPRQHAAMLAVITEGTRCPIDVPAINGNYFLNAAGVGFDAVVADTVNRQFRKLRGVVPYLLAVLKTLGTYRNAPLEIVLDNQPPRQMRCLLVAAGNGQWYGGGLRICPQADPADGYLDICIAGDLAKPDVLVTLPRLFPGTHISHPKCIYTRARTAQVSGPPLPVQADGQIVGTLPVTFGITPAALWVMQPTASHVGR